MTRWVERSQLPSNSLTTCSMGAGRTPRIRFSFFMVRMDIWFSFAAQRKEMRSPNNTKGCLHGSARSKKRGVCHIKRQIRLAFGCADAQPGTERTQKRIMKDQDFITSFQNEWKGTKIIFQVSKQDGKTQLRFTHEGLVPEYECFNVCSNAWGSYINGSLRNLIET